MAHTPHRRSTARKGNSGSVGHIGRATVGLRHDAATFRAVGRALSRVVVTVLATRAVVRALSELSTRVPTMVRDPACFPCGVEVAR